MAEPTDEQLKEYAGKLPDVYRAMLSSFVTFTELTPWGEVHVPNRRRAGASLTLDTLDARLQKNFDLYRPGDTEDALAQLVEKKFLEEYEEPILHYKPTLLGDRLITVITGSELAPQTLPELPELVWA